MKTRSGNFQNGTAVLLPPKCSRKLGEILHERHELPGDVLEDALARQRRHALPLGRILVSEGALDEDTLIDALAEQFAMRPARGDGLAPDPALVSRLGADFCLRHQLVPLRRKNGLTLVATADPAGMARIRGRLAARLGPVRLILAPAARIEAAIDAAAGGQLSDHANARCPPQYSCRSWARPLGWPRLLLGLAAIGALAVTFPRIVMWLAFLWVLLNLALTTLVRLSALVMQIGTRLHQTPRAPRDRRRDIRLPVVSVLVPLHREDAILPALIRRLDTTTYPRALLDVVLVLEEGDRQTRAALGRITLPRWMRVVHVPPSTLRTKPRAMNYALHFCRGDIIGIYDAEDAPEPDQIMRIVRHFHDSPPEVACIQGYLDFYNPRQNWLARCFTIEYALWFRVVLHGIERLGLPVPLGGTTVFFRRDALERLGAWDAHNVTEDADLGFRLARLGYRCAFLDTTTREEANCHPLRWVRQRSRWLKGYAMTWITHMRAPRRLWRDLGMKGFLAFQVVLLGTLSTFALAPMIWSLWLISLGVVPFYVHFLPWQAWVVLATGFVVSEIVLLVSGLFAVSGPGHRHLMAWVPTMMFYWPLGTLAVYKALYELLIAPFYWDKTSHGTAQPCAQPGGRRAPGKVHGPNT